MKGSKNVMEPRPRPWIERRPGRGVPVGGERVKGSGGKALGIVPRGLGGREGETPGGGWGQGRARGGERGRKGNGAGWNNSIG